MSASPSASSILYGSTSARSIEVITFDLDYLKSCENPPWLFYGGQRYHLPALGTEIIPTAPDTAAVWPPKPLCGAKLKSQDPEIIFEEQLQRHQVCRNCCNTAWSHSDRFYDSYLAPLGSGHAISGKEFLDAVLKQAKP